MADKKISELSNAAALTGTELMELVQGGVNLKTTPAAIAALASGGVSSVNARTGAVTGVVDTVNTAVTLADGATIDLTAIKHTLATASSRTFTISYTGDDITMEITLSATSATQTFPAGSLCVSDGVASGDNTCPMAGASGDKYIFAIKKIGSVFYIVAKNFGQ